MNLDKLKILQHSLGVDKYGKGPMYRNRFVTGPGSSDWAHCVELCDCGVMKDYGPLEIAAGDHCFVVTDAGIRAVAEHSPDPPELTRSQKRYQEFLRSGCDLGYAFGQWLKLGLYKKTEQ